GKVCGPGKSGQELLLRRGELLLLSRELFRRDSLELPGQNAPGMFDMLPEHVYQRGITDLLHLVVHLCCRPITQLITEFSPGAVLVIPDFPEIEKHVVVVGTEADMESLFAQLPAVPDILHAVRVIPEDVVVAAVPLESEGMAQRGPPKFRGSRSTLYGYGGRTLYPAGS